MHAVILGFVSPILTYICWRPKLEAISGILVYDIQRKRKYVQMGVGGLGSVFFNTAESPDADLTPDSSFFRGFHSSFNSNNSNTLGNILWKYCPSWTRDRLDLDISHITHYQVIGQENTCILYILYALHWIILHLPSNLDQENHLPDP